MNLAEIGHLVADGERPRNRRASSESESVLGIARHSKSHAKAQSRQGSQRLSGLCAFAALRETKPAFRMPLGSNPDLWPLFAFHEFPGLTGAAEGVADLPEIRRLVADGERGRDRVVRGGVEVDGQPRRQRVKVKAANAITAGGMMNQPMRTTASL